MINKRRGRKCEYCDSPILECDDYEISKDYSIITIDKVTDGRIMWGWEKIYWHTSCEEADE